MWLPLKSQFFKYDYRTTREQKGCLVNHVHPKRLKSTQLPCLKWLLKLWIKYIYYTKKFKKAVEFLFGDFFDILTSSWRFFKNMYVTMIFKNCLQCVYSLMARTMNSNVFQGHFYDLHLMTIYAIYKNFYWLDVWHLYNNTFY